MNRDNDAYEEFVRVSYNLNDGDPHTACMSVPATRYTRWPQARSSEITRPLHTGLPARGLDPDRLHKLPRRWGARALGSA